LKTAFGQYVIIYEINSKINEIRNKIRYQLTRLSITKSTHMWSIR